jgi:DNA recombination protein RmuC
MEWIVLALLVVIALLLIAVLVMLLQLRKAGQGVDVLAPIQQRVDQIALLQDRAEKGMRDDFARSREEMLSQARAQRVELAASFKHIGDTLMKTVGETSTMQKHQLDAFAGQIASLRQSSEQRLDRLRETIEQRLKSLQDDNNLKLEKMRATVDEKLQGTLEKRLGESFKLVSERLEQVHKGLGEMQSLASGVGDLKRVLTNVKTRGTWGEIQLGNLLEQFLTPEQYATNVATIEGSANRVEFAIRMPSRDDHGNTSIWLPIDSKFPQEDYQRLIDCSELADADGVDAAGKALETRIKQSAKDIRDKYVQPPGTTDFGILFIPTEGMFVELVRRPGLVDYLQRECRIVVAGPTTLAALLNSLQMGFRTLAIQKRSSEVWKLLSTIRDEFSKFGVQLEKVKKKLTEASNVVDQATGKTRTITRHLNKVHDAPPDEPLALDRAALFVEAADDDAAEADDEAVAE